MKDAVEFDNRINDYLDKMRCLIKTDCRGFSQAREQCLAYLAVQKSYYEGVYGIVSSLHYRGGKV